MMPLFSDASCTLWSSSFGGPLAVSRDVARPGVTVSRPVVSVMTQAGRLLKSFQLEASDKSSGGAVIGLGWTCMEDLVVVKESGEVQVRSMFGALKSVFSLVVKESHKCVDFRLFSTVNSFSGMFTTGVCLLLLASSSSSNRDKKSGGGGGGGEQKFVCVKDVYDPKLQHFPDVVVTGVSSASLNAEWDSWCIISTDKKCFVLASKGQEVYQLALGATPILLKTASLLTSAMPPFGCFTKMVLLLLIKLN